MLWVPRKKRCLFAAEIRESFMEEATHALGHRVYGELQQYEYGEG